jgi:cellulose synthase (UDP-forming)
MGSNALIRRQALLSIGGYQPGLAEDLATSIALHAAGWHSAYVAEPLAPGLSPSSLAAWSIQQLKWARGVFELLLTSLPSKFGRLTWGQRISYCVRMTKYWIGPAVFLHLAATILVLLFGDVATRAAFHNYLWHLMPLVALDVVIRGYALERHRHEDLPESTLLGAVVLVYASWPVYLVAWTFALLRLPVRFRPTPKDRLQRLSVVWLLPQIITVVLLMAGLYQTVMGRHRISLVLAAAIAQGMLQLLLLLRWVKEDEMHTVSLRSRLFRRKSAAYANRNY